MSVREYIGARYVPIFADPIEWDASKAYEPLTIVQYQGNSYTSRQYVPAGLGTPDQHGDFWAETGNYNAQIEQYRNEVLLFDSRIRNNATAIADVSGEVDEISDTYIKTFNSVEDAKNNATENDKYIRTISYYANGNSGGALYAVKTTEPTSYYEEANSGVYLEIIDPVNVSQFGAKGDGITDDTSVIQNAINEMDVINFESGKTYVTANLLIDSDNKTLIGNGCTLKTEDFKVGMLETDLNIGGTSINVDHPEYFHVNQPAMIYNANSSPKFYKVVVTGIEGNTLRIAAYKPFRPENNSGDASPYYFPAGSAIYTGTQIMTITHGMNASSASINVKNVDISGFTFQQSTSNVRLENWFQIAYGIMVYHTEGFRFHDNYVNGASTAFFNVYSYNRDVVIEHNIFYNIPSAYPIIVHWDMIDINVNNRNHNVRVNNNTFTECPRAVLFSSVDKGECRNNLCTMTTARIWEMFYIYGGDVSVYPDYSEYDQESFYTQEIIISGNKINCSVKSGIGVYFNGAKNCQASKNVFLQVERNFGLQACKDIDIFNNLLKHTRTNENDCAVIAYGAIENIYFHDNSIDGGRLLNINSHLKQGSETDYFGYSTSTLYIVNNTMIQTGRTSIISVNGSTETQSHPVKLMDVPALLYIEGNTVITDQAQSVGAVQLNSALLNIISSYASLVTNQIYLVNNVVSSSFSINTDILPVSNTPGNIALSRTI